VTLLDDININQPDSWLCIDCGMDTAPGVMNRPQILASIDMAMMDGRWDKGEWSVPLTFTPECEVYIVNDSVWRAAGNPEGCLCIGCLERRLGRGLMPRDFPPDHPMNGDRMPGTARLLKAQGRKATTQTWPTRLRAS
jgi:hypothetical protein